MAERRAGTAAAMRVALVYDMDACRGPTGVTRHALAQLDRLAQRPDVDLTVVSRADHRARRPGLLGVARRPAPPRDAAADPRRPPLVAARPLAAGRVVDRAGRLGLLPGRVCRPDPQARRAVTSHDVLQDLTLGGPQAPRALLAKVFGRGRPGPLGLAVQHRAAARDVPRLPRARWPTSPTRADDLFFEPATDAERAAVRADLGLPPGMPYLLSVANFQPRKNLARLVRAAARLARGGRGRPGAGPARRPGPTPRPRPIRDAIGRGRPAGRGPAPRLPPGPAAPRRLCRGDGPGLPLDLRELRHPRRRGDGPGHPRRPGRLDRPARDRRRGRLVLRSRATTTRSSPPSATCSTDPTSAPAASRSAGRSPSGFRWQAANDRLVEALQG